MTQILTPDIESVSYRETSVSCRETSFTSLSTYMRQHLHDSHIWPFDIFSWPSKLWTARIFHPGQLFLFTHMIHISFDLFDDRFDPTSQSDLSTLLCNWPSIGEPWVHSARRFWLAVSQNVSVRSTNRMRETQRTSHIASVAFVPRTIEGRCFFVDLKMTLSEKGAFSARPLNNSVMMIY